MQRTTSTPLAALLAVLVFFPSSAGAQPQTAAQRSCIVKLNRAAARVANTRIDAFVHCVRLGVKGELPAGQTVEQCIAADRGGQVARARELTEQAEARWCSVAPSFGPSSAAAANAIFDRMHQLTSIFGADPDAALAPSARNGKRRACQMAMTRGLARLTRAKLREFNMCKESGLRSGSIDSAADLEACFGADPKGHLAKALETVDKQIARACARQPVATTFPGDCAGEAVGDLAACAEPRAHCDVCLGLNEADRTTKPCHRFAEGLPVAYCGDAPETSQSVARQWNEELLAAIRIDTPRPVVHARNLFHLSVAMYDAWAAYQSTADPYLHDEPATATDVAEARDAAISFAAYRLLRHRFVASPGAATSLARFDTRHYALGYDKSFTSLVGSGPAALGNRIAAAVIAYGLADGSNEAGGYDDPTYTPLNEPLVVKNPGTVMVAPNNWQPLALDVMIGQNGVPIPGKVQRILGAGWGAVLPFALVRSAPGVPYFDPLAPPLLGTASDAEFKDSAVEVIRMQSLLDSTDPTMIDGSPGTMGNNTLGANDGTGRPLNPITGAPYAPNTVKRNDFYRVLGMYWADGPESETPPGHWNVVANEVSDSPGFAKRIGGTGPVLGDLEWDVKLYLALNGAEHDAAVAAWEQKRVYDSVRPISMIRHMGGLGQSSDPGGPSYHPDGLPLVPDLIEVITAASSAPGERHAHLSAFVGEIAVRGWKGEPPDPRNQVGGIDWIRAKSWVAYQKSTFVTPPFPGFVSGHSTYSRSAAELMALFTGSEFFPGGLGEFHAPADTYLPPERGPTAPTTLQWATYYDAADQAGISRLWSGIHIRADDFEGRKIGAEVGVDAFELAMDYFDGTAVP